MCAIYSLLTPLLSCLPHQLFACKGVRMGESVLPQIYAHAPVEGGLGINVKKVT